MQIGLADDGATERERVDCVNILRCLFINGSDDAIELT